MKTLGSMRMLRFHVVPSEKTFELITTERLITI